MENRAPYILMGGFVLAAFGLAFSFILWIGQSQHEYDEYRIVFTEQVSGLNTGGAVRFNGIQVGEVKDLEINEDGLVEALVRIDTKTPVKTDTVARLEIVGFTGLAIIQFEGGTHDARFLKDTISGTPIIQAQPSDIGLLLSGSSSIVEGANKVLSDENIKNISGIIANINTLTGTLVDSRDDISVVIANTALITEDLARASDDLDRLIKDLNLLANNEGSAALASISEVAANTKELIVELQAVVGENRENLRGFSSNGLAQVGPGLTEIRRLVRTADNFLRQLERDPRGYLLGEPVPEYEAAQ